MLTRDIASDTQVMTAVLRPWVGSFEFARGRVVTGMLRFLMSGVQHPMPDVMTCESAYDAGIMAGHNTRDGEGESIQREQLMKPFFRPRGQTRQRTWISLTDLNILKETLCTKYSGYLLL